MNDQCFSYNSSWSTSPTLTMILSTSQIFTRSVYSLANSSVISVDPQSDPIPTLIPASDVLSILDFVFLIPDPTSTKILTAVIDGIRKGSAQSKYDAREISILCSTLILLITQISQAPLPGPSPILGYQAQQIYRILVSPLSRYLFTILSLVVWTWCAGILVYCWSRDYHVPETTFFPEIDFARNVLAMGKGVPDWLTGNGNVVASIGGETLFIRIPDQSMDNKYMVGIEGKL